MRQIERMNSKQGKPADLHTNLASLSANQGNLLKQKEMKENGLREKKIATKAYKGFDILLKSNHQLYKNFMNVFTRDLARDQVKGIEIEINTLINKSSDMRDIFEDYL